MAYITFETGHAGSRRPAQGSLIAVAVGLMIFGAGVFKLAGLPWSQIQTSVEARAWPVAAARVLSASIDERAVPSDAGIETELSLLVEYEFQTLCGIARATGATLTDRSAPEDRRLLSLYRRLEFARVTGRTIPVSYDPDEPSRAFIDTSLPWGQMLPVIGFGIACLLLGSQFLFRPAERRSSFRLPR